MIEVELPDGTVIEVETNDPQQAAAAARRFLASRAQAQPAPAPANPAQDMGTLDRLRAGIASGGLQGFQALRNTLNDATEWVVENVPGVRQIDEFGARIGIDPIDVAAPRDRAAQMETRERDRPLADTTAGKVGQVIGTAAAVSPTALIPGAGTYTGAALIGAGSGAALSEGGERAGGAVIGAAGGVAGNAIGNAVSNAIRSGIGRARSLVAGGASVDDAAAKTLDDALAANGVRLQDIPAQARADLLAEVRRAVATGDVVDAAALARKADFAAIGATPTRGQITRDPQQFAFEQTLQGVQGAGDDLANIANQNNRVLIDTLNRTGAAAAPGDAGADRAVRGALSSFAERQKAEIDQLYRGARDAGGRSAAIDQAFVATRAGELLDGELKNAFLPGDIRAMLNDFATGKVPLTVQTAEQFKTILATAQRSTQDGNVSRAIGLVRQAVDEAPVSSDAGTAAIEAFNRARAANRKFMGRVEAMPALKATLDSTDPDRFFDRYVLKGDLSDVRRVGAILRAPEQEGRRQAIKAQVVAHLKNKALNGATDEVGNFSQSGYNKALMQFGEQRLKALGFTADEVNTLKTVGRVSSYIQSAPAGAKVNRSNTASQGYNLLLGMLGKFGTVPVVGPMVAQPLREGAQRVAGAAATRATVPVTRVPAASDVVGRTFPATGAVVTNEAMR